ncbi:hypothetical protein DUNSADRAFT_6436 [Dunaliella salina]|uniref:Uncharacterized protein n=1 Tax=Dunaliella salina TaxID=3046 RepID=A0ABQ7H6V1_DUNSA|nr:hypothetical protein DUNSADRAFT_6436 [Dunaliella salina]|eukprot:KAF5842587.1 hypothetical protein DUNSADRAFT_6436 [Dunaliella salina]
MLCHPLVCMLSCLPCSFFLSPCTNSVGCWLPMLCHHLCMLSYLPCSFVSASCVHSVGFPCTVIVSGLHAFMPAMLFFPFPLHKLCWLLAAHALSSFLHAFISAMLLYVCLLRTLCWLPMHCHRLWSACFCMLSYLPCSLMSASCPFSGVCSNSAIVSGLHAFKCAMLFHVCPLPVVCPCSVIVAGQHTFMPTMLSFSFPLHKLCGLLAAPTLSSSLHAFISAMLFYVCLLHMLCWLPKHSSSLVCMLSYLPCSSMSFPCIHPGVCTYSVTVFGPHVAAHALSFQGSAHALSPTLSRPLLSAHLLSSMFVIRLPWFASMLLFQTFQTISDISTVLVHVCPQPLLCCPPMLWHRLWSTSRLLLLSVISEVCSCSGQAWSSPHASLMCMHAGHVLTCRPSGHAHSSTVLASCLFSPVVFCSVRRPPVQCLSSHTLSPSLSSQALSSSSFMCLADYPCSVSFVHRRLPALSFVVFDVHACWPCFVMSRI